MGMEMSSVRAVMQHQGLNPEEGSDLATISSDPLGYMVTGREGAHPGTAGQAVSGQTGSGKAFGGSGGGDSSGGGSQLEGAAKVNQLEEDRKTRRRQVERTTTRLSRVSKNMRALHAQQTKKQQNNKIPTVRVDPKLQCLRVHRVGTYSPLRCLRFCVCVCLCMRA